MKILKNGSVIYFSCSECGCEFAEGKNSIQNNNGKFYAWCPTCGSRCHTDMTRLSEYTKKYEGKVEKE